MCVNATAAFFLEHFLCFFYTPKRSNVNRWCSIIFLALALAGDTSMHTVWFFGCWYLFSMRRSLLNLNERCASSWWNHVWMSRNEKTEKEGPNETSDNTLVCVYTFLSEKEGKKLNQFFLIKYRINFSRFNFKSNGIGGFSKKNCVIVSC